MMSSGLEKKFQVTIYLLFLLK